MSESKTLGASTTARWKKDQPSVVRELEAKTNSFFTKVNGVRANDRGYAQR
jgi:hypothetical protein